MSLRTPLGRARGLGAAKDGVHHFIAQRATAIALVPLVLWFVGSIVFYAGADYEAVRAYLAQPLVAILMTLLILAGFYHMRLGLQVVVEDYIASDGLRIALLLFVNFAGIGLAVACLFAVLRISLTG
jgi:succinate dehydrogenase / fumarate reductase membrane anchor subunit